MQRERVYGDICVGRLFPSGALHVSAMRRGHYCSYTYYGYTVREALRLFRREFPA
jgi:hypothetical protein